MPQVFNGIFHALLPLPLLGVLVGFCLFLCGLSLCICGIGLCFRGILQCLGTLVGHQGLQGEQDTAHPDADKLQNLVFGFPCFRFPYP